MSPLERYGHWIIRHRRRVIVAWVFVALFGMFGSSQVSNRWDESFSIPGYSAYEANQRTLKALDIGENPPLVLVFRSPGDVTATPGIRQAIESTAAAVPGARTSSYFSSHSRAFVSPDGHTMFANIYPAGPAQFDATAQVDATRAALAKSAPAGTKAYLTGFNPLFIDEGGGSNGPGLAVEILIGAVGAMVILLFVFGTLPAIAMPLAVAACSILTTFGFVWAFTYLFDISIIVQFLVALIGLGVAIDYSLLMIFRFREELARGSDTETALVNTMTHAGRSVIVSGSTVAVGLLSMIILPLPFIRSIGIGGMLIPTVSVITSMTLLPALLSILGPRINSKRVMPKRFSHAGDPDSGPWRRWAAYVDRRPLAMAVIGLVIVAVLLIPAFQLNPGDAQAKNIPGNGPADVGRDTLYSSGLPQGALLPHFVVVENGASPGQLDAIAKDLGATPGIQSAVAEPSLRSKHLSIVEAFTSQDPESTGGRDLISELKDTTLPAIASKVDSGLTLTLGGGPAEGRDFVHAVYGNFPFVLLFVVVLTYLLLARAFRSLVLPLKAVILNLMSLGAAYGIVVFIFQQGHGSEAIWNVPASQAIISWIPLMIFAFLFGLSMDYEVFMLTRMRETYDEVGNTADAISLGLARTAKLVTSAALILMFAFFALSTGPSVDIKQFGVGLAAGIIFDATVIRALLVPAIMHLLGSANWYFPERAAKLLFVGRSAPERSS